MNSSSDSIKTNFEKVQDLESKLPVSEKSSLGDPSMNGQEQILDHDSPGEENTSSTLSKNNISTQTDRTSADFSTQTRDIDKKKCRKSNRIWCFK